MKDNLPRCAKEFPQVARFSQVGTELGVSLVGDAATSVVNPSDVEARLAAPEARMEEVAADAAAARHLAAARDRDLACHRASGLL